MLGLTLLCAVVAQEAPRGRERLRQLVQKAREGDTEAQAILASRRRKIVRQRTDSTGNGREQSAVQAALGGAASRGPGRRTSSQPTSAPASPRARLPSSRTRLRESRRGGSRVSEEPVTTFRPTFLTTTEAPTTTTLAPTEPAPVQDFESASESQFKQPEPVEIPTVDLTPTDEVPSIFQPAQFGPRGVGRPSGTELASRPQTPVQRTREPESRPRSSVQRPISRQQPHRAINSGLEISSRSELFTPGLGDPNESTSTRAPPVQTLRRYSFFNEEGAYVFGYEAEDGSFKEEIRGRDCIVNGKYGYVDPSGIRREFTYVSGNKCDPNNPDGLLPDGSPIPLNDQFLQQTQEQQLGQAELEKLALNRRRQPVQRTQTLATEPDRSSRRLTSRTQSRPVQQLETSQPRPIPEQTPQRQPQQTREPEVRPVDLTPSNDMPDMFKPAQFKPASERDRFPVPDFIDQAPQRIESEQARSRSQRPETQKPVKVQATRKQETKPVDLTPTNIIPNMFQPAQFGSDRRGVAPKPDRAPAQKPVFSQPELPQTTAQPRSFITHAPTESPISSFNFNQEFNNNFLSHFGASQPFQELSPNRAPPRSNTRATQPPPPPPTPAPSTISNTIPSIFRPAQFNDNRPVPTQAPARPPIQDNAFVLTSQQPGTAPQLVFDASTGGFKTVHVQTGSQFNAAAQPVQSRPPPPPPQRAPSNPFTPGRTLFDTSAPAQGSVRSPLPPIPTSAAEFDSFFAQLG